VEPLYYLIHRECRYVSDSATRRWQREGEREEGIVFVAGATKAGRTWGREKEKRTGASEG